jgi:Beta-propeller repeat
MPTMKKLVVVTCAGIGMYLSAHVVLSADSVSQVQSSSYFGNYAYDEATDTAVDGSGFVYVVGFSELFGGNADAFVLKLTPDGSQVVYSRYFRGTGFDIANAVAVDAAGAVYVAGHTTSADFPLVHPLQPNLGGSSDMWVAKLDPFGSIVYSTYYGGSSFENGDALALGPGGEVYISGGTGSTDLPGVNGVQRAYAGGFSDGFVAKVAPNGGSIQYATYLGGSGSDELNQVALGTDGQIYVGGYTSSLDFPVASAFQPAFGGGFTDGLVAKLSADGTRVVFSSYLGGVDRDAVIGLTVDAQGGVYLAGNTSSYNFPTYNAYKPYNYSSYSDAFVTKLQPGGTALVFSTFFGGQGDDGALDIAIDAAGQIHLAGQTASYDFPLVGAVQEQVLGFDAFAAQLTPDGSTVVRSTPIGGSGFDTANRLAFSAAGDVWVVGRTDSEDFPILNAFQSWLGGSTDAFVTRLSAYSLPNRVPVAFAGHDASYTIKGCTARVLLNGWAWDDDGDPLTFTWTGDFGTATGPTAVVDLPGGPHTITLTVTDGRGGVATDTVDVFVNDIDAPTIAGATATPNVLGPPNHQMVPVSIAVSVPLACGAYTTCRIVSISSSDPVNGLGDGDSSPDWEVTGPLSLLLRAERALGSARTYTVTVECVDGSGLAARTSVAVTVPRL